MTATPRTTAFVWLASLLVGIGSARAQHMEPPAFEQKEPPRVLPPPPPPAPPRREEAPAPPVPPRREEAPAAPRQPPSSTQWRPAPPAPPRPAPAPPAPVAPPPSAPVAPSPPASLAPPPRQLPPSVQSPPRRQSPSSVPSPPARVQAPQSSPARSDADDAIDDPKMWRRLGPRIGVPGPAPPPPRATARPAPAPLPPPPVAPLPPPVSAPAAAADADQTTLVRPYTPAREPTFEPTLPRLKLGLRRFDFVRIGASNTPDGVAAPQTFNSFSVDVYPVSRVVRIGLTSAFGWESGTFVTNGDYFATQTVSLGAQYRDFGRIVPFAEAFMGVGYMRRVQFDRTIPTAFWNFGVDAGVEVYVARVGYLSLALGYMRPINGFARRQIFTSVFVDTWSVKIGIGI